LENNPIPVHLVCPLLSFFHVLQLISLTR
jgi:acetylornithine deacetylase/succinyl-diaminopimelate desuccinylase-like protein